MLRGAIDYNDGLHVGGWIFSPLVPLRGTRVLAFVGDACVGAGEIELHRPDLAEAGLGDGWCGFNFPVGLTDPADADRIAIALEASDFRLLPRGGRIVGANGLTSETTPGRGDYSPGAIDWMRRRGWLDQTGFDFLKAVLTIGLYDRSLTGADMTPLDPLEEARRLFALYRQDEVEVQEARVALHDLAAERASLADGAAIPIVAIHAPGGAIRLIEGSGDPRRRGPPEVAGAVRHACGADRLLLIDTRATFAGETGATARIFRAV